MYSNSIEMDIFSSNNNTLDQSSNNVNLEKVLTKKILQFENISVGNGKYYEIDSAKINSFTQQRLNYDSIQQFIQIFIELRNALGYTSQDPHNYSIIEITEAIKTLQIEYAKEYNILFTYGYKIIKADPLNESNNFRKIHILYKERKKEYAPYMKPIIPISIQRQITNNNSTDTNNNEDNKLTNEKFVHEQIKNTNIDDKLNNKRFNETSLSNIYTPQPNNKLNLLNNTDLQKYAPEVSSMSRIYGNRHVKRRKRAPIIPLYKNHEF